MVKKKGKAFSTIVNVLNIVAISLIGLASVIFASLYIDAFNDGFIVEYSTLITVTAVTVITALTVLTLLFKGLSKNFIYKLFYIAIVIILIVMTGLYIMKITGFLEKINSVEDFRNYIASFKGYAVVLFIVIQFLQVVVLPIPSFITVGAGVLLFGSFYGALYSTIGIICGSIVGFFIGRVFGFKVVKWLVGEKNLNKALKAIKGKDKIIITFMLLFPFFPDDIICFAAGITTMSVLYYIIMIIVTRIISIFISSYSMNNQIIPYNTWWGILLWVLFFAICVFLSLVIYKKGEKIENFFKRKKSKKNK